MSEHAMRWQYFPKSEPCALGLLKIVEVFEDNFELISSFVHDDQPSDTVHKKVRPGLENFGFKVEKNKRDEGKIFVPVLFSENGKIEKSFEADAYHPGHKIVLEVEAGRGYLNNQFLKDLFQACVMQDVDYLAIAVRQIYRGTKDYEKVVAFIDTLYVSSKFNLPLSGVLILGY